MHELLCNPPKYQKMNESKKPVPVTACLRLPLYSCSLFFLLLMCTYFFLEISLLVFYAKVYVLQNKPLSMYV